MIKHFAEEAKRCVSSTKIVRNTCSTNGLTIELIDPFTKWRVTYNGLCYIAKPGNGIEQDDVELQHVTFTFLYVIWN